VADVLDELANTALETIASGYYGQLEAPESPRNPASFVELIGRKPGRVLVCEVKPASPSRGVLSSRPPCEMVDLYVEGGADGLSILTEPVHFGGALDTLVYAGRQGLPVLFKDFVLDSVQLDAAARGGASAVLLILALFERGHAAVPLETMIGRAHEAGLEVLLEVYDRPEYDRALKTEVDMIGINNRDLKALKVDLGTTERVLRGAKKDRPVWALSGVGGPEALRALRTAQVEAFLVGTSLMESDDPSAQLNALMEEVPH